MTSFLSVRMVEEAHGRLGGVVRRTPLEKNGRLSERYGASVYLKREDLQVVRSYKLRGAYNRMALLSPEERRRGVVTASAGNHAQGVAFSCARLGVRGDIYMPKNTPRQKVERVAAWGGSWTSLHLVGDTFDEAAREAERAARKGRKKIIHPFDDPLVAAGQGSVAAEIVEQLGEAPACIVVPVGGGGLLAGVGTYIKAKDPRARVIAAEPSGAASLAASLKAGRIVTLPHVDTFVDGAAVKRVGAVGFRAARSYADRIVKTPEGLVCREMIALYQSDGIVAEPAGALSVAALDLVRKDVRGKTVVCILSGGNNDVSRYAEVIERSLVYQGLKHYFMIEFSQRPGALKGYLVNALGPDDDITFFEYAKKNNRETGPALVGIELKRKGDLRPLLRRMDTLGIEYQLLKGDSPVFKFLV